MMMPKHKIIPGHEKHERAGSSFLLSLLHSQCYEMHAAPSVELSDSPAHTDSIVTQTYRLILTY